MIRSFAVVYNASTVRAHRRDCRRVVRFRVDYTLAPAENGARRRFQNQIVRELKRRFNIFTARGQAVHRLRYYLSGVGIAWTWIEPGDAMSHHLVAPFTRLRLASAHSTI